jgi:hypothetical protein
MSNSQVKNTSIQDQFHQKAIDLINAQFDSELLNKSFFTSKRSIEKARAAELIRHQQSMDSLQKNTMPLPLKDTATGRNDAYLQSVKLINDYFDEKMLKKSIFSSIISIQMARKVELEKLEKKFFTKQLRN